MKRCIVEFADKCLNCQQVKVEHQRPGGMAQNIELPNWKWEMINMDFITGLLWSRIEHDSILVIVDRMTKSAHLLSVNTTFSAEDYSRLFIQEIVRVNLSTAFHPQTDSQEERTIQTLEDMLRACVINFKDEFGFIGPYLVHQAMEKVKIIQERFKTTQSRQKSYINVRRRDLEFEVDDWVHLKVSPMKGVMRFGKKWKLRPRYIGPYRISKTTENIGIKDNLSYEEIPIEILDRQVQKLRTKEIASVKVLFQNKFVEEATWEAEEDMKQRYPHLFSFREIPESVC
ncbi:hypothetical protein MTR67_023691 [Solanum verrucosum]|uniref:Uncharacterized protein n=1 Tax=Solanum verrucosum TaxID=315347 RepID=A0AAF0TS28_SOLVR|nr:hypothetical protein MTR67_023691 [Solanum verrucosum]